jgi:hypothetical protein
MDDGDGAGMVEMMSGGAPDAILATMYNGSASCLGCGGLMTPVQVMYAGNSCVDCTSKKGASRVKNRMA